jgi:hypothetical protein
LNKNQNTNKAMNNTNTDLNKVFFEEFFILKAQVKQLIDQNNESKSQIEQLKFENNELKQDVENLKAKRDEHYYQRFLEKCLGATHKKTALEITDITTENEHIEIKHWKNYKAAYGQLSCYNHNDNKTLCAYFFGDIKSNLRESIIDFYRTKNVSIKEFINTPNGIEIHTVLDATLEKQNKKEKNFNNWIDEHICYKENSVLNLKDICYAYYKEHLNIHQKNKLRKDFEEIISKKYKNINNICIQSRHNGIKFYGWKNLALL